MLCSLELKATALDVSVKYGALSELKEDSGQDCFNLLMCLRVETLLGCRMKEFL